MTFKLPLSTRTYIYQRDGGMCAYCVKFVPWDQYDVDHIVPRAYGGKHELGNLRVSHRSCNRRAGSRMVRPGASGLPMSEGSRW